MSDSNQLVKMANDIGNFFRPQPEGDAVAGIANHIRNFWTRRMIEKLSAHPEGLDELPRQALARVVPVGAGPVGTTVDTTVGTVGGSEVASDSGPTPGGDAG